MPVNAFAAIIPADRIIDWSLTGHPGGIPTDRTNISINVKTTLISSNLCAGDGITDDTAHLRNALLAFGNPGNVIYLPTGVYRVTGPMQIPNYKQGWTIRGDGPGKTIILCDAPSSTDFLQLNGSDGTFTTANIIGLMPKGTTNVVLDTAITGTLTHRLMEIDQLNDGLIVTERGAQGIGVTNRGTTFDFHNTGLRNKEQVVLVTSISNGTNLTFWPPLYDAMNTNLSPQVNVFDAALTDGDIGIEDMTFTNKSNTHNFVVLNAQDGSWIKNVEFQNGGRGSAPVLLSLCLNLEVRNCIFGSPSTNSDCVIYFLQSDNARIEDNIFDGGGLVYSCSAGNAVTYNIFTNTPANPSSFMGGALSLNHGAHSYLNLFEGNVSGGFFQADYYWGSSGLNTFYRNVIAGYENSQSSNLKCLTLDRNSLSNNVYGNVLGSPAVTWTGVNADPVGDVAYPYTHPYIYRLGYPMIGNNGFAGTANVDTANADNFDPRVAATLLRTNNFDYATASIVNPYAGTLPASLIYTNGAPSWWGNKRWPAIDPNGSPMLVNIPAQDRFLASQAVPRFAPFLRP